MTQVRQTPTPQHMCSSIDNSAGMSKSPAILPTARSIGVGPQANSLRLAALALAVRPAAAG